MESTIEKLYEEAEKRGNDMNKYARQMELHEVAISDVDGRIARKWFSTYRMRLPAPLSTEEYEIAKRHYLCTRMEYGRAIKKYFEAKFGTTCESWTAFANETHQAWVDYVTAKL